MGLGNGSQTLMRNSIVHNANGFQRRRAFATLNFLFCRLELHPCPMVTVTFCDCAWY
ncbi:hypothetical protein D3C77_27220 [compost metagenome]